MIYITKFFILSVLALASFDASAGVYIRGKSQATVVRFFGQNSKSNSEFEIYLENDKFRQNTRSASENTSVIVRSDKKVMWVLNHKKKTYTEMNETHVKAFRKQMEELRRNPQSAKVMDSLLKAGTELVRVDRFVPDGTDTAMKGSCSKYVGYRGNKKVMEVCVIPARIFSAASAAQKKALTATKFMMEMFPPQMMQKQISALIDSSAIHLGYPVKVTYLVGKSISGRTELLELADKWFMDQSVFEIPAGYRKENR